ASSLGVRREAVSLALPKMGGCSIRRGHLEITDRSLLEKEACECYFQLKVTHRDQRKLPFSES
ncbi:MAG: Crp/Fnr family transcriptional regulator, partial [Betaproteobacteria bacterium]|nr:Crp/Fnr family transcriptional regulator [Betaproteobacteria bacterium]